MDEVKLTVTAASGIEAVAKRELKKLGFAEPKAERGAMSVTGALSDIARLNVFLRTADRVYLDAGAFRAETFDALFDGVYSLRWEDYCRRETKVIVNGKSVKSRLFALSACQKIVKKAITKRLSEKYKLRVLPESGETLYVFFDICCDTAVIRIDTTGTGLHKRGYRDMVGAAPIRENLAAAMVLLSGYSYRKPLRDPFCGSGTIAVEAALYALDVAPGIFRKFAFEDFCFMPQGAIAGAREEAKDRERRDREIDVIGSDIDPRAVKLAERHARRAGVADKVKFEVGDAREFCSPLSDGVIVTNPPYGDRVLTEREARALYGALGRAYRGLDNWSLFAIAEDKDFERALGKKADKTRKLYNSDKECRLYEYFGKRENDYGRKNSD